MKSKEYKPTTPYIPINCSFHDVLLEKATFKALCTIVYRSEGKEISITSKILDVYTKDKAEFMKLENDVVIRLDFIVSVDGASFESPNCSV